MAKKKPEPQIVIDLRTSFDASVLNPIVQRIINSAHHVQEGKRNEITFEDGTIIASPACLSRGKRWHVRSIDREPEIDFSVTVSKKGETPLRAIARELAVMNLTPDELVDILRRTKKPNITQATVHREDGKYAYDVSGLNANGQS